MLLAVGLAAGLPKAIVLPIASTGARVRHVAVVAILALVLCHAAAAFVREWSAIAGGGACIALGRAR